MTVINIKRSNNNDKSVLSEVLSVTKNDTSDITNAKTVNEHLACLNRRKLFHIILVDFKNTSDITDINVLAFHTEKHCKVGMFSEVFLFAVNRDKILWLYKLLHDF